MKKRNQNEISYKNDEFNPTFITTIFNFSFLWLIKRLFSSLFLNVKPNGVQHPIFTFFTVKFNRITSLIYLKVPRKIYLKKS